MDNPMTPSAMTDRQINKSVEQYTALLRKHSSEFKSEAVQLVLGDPGFIKEVFGVFRRHVEAVSGTIIRHVHVDRTKTAMQVLDATGRYKWCNDEKIIVEMPLEGREEENVEFFDLNYNPSGEEYNLSTNSVKELDREYEARGLRPDPAAVAQAMADDPAFADERPVVVQWRDRRGHACYAIFNRDDDKRRVRVGWHNLGWNRFCRFAGVRK